MITGIKEWKTLANYISCESKWWFDGEKCNSDQWWNSDKCRCECKKRHICKNDCIWSSATCSCKNGKYLSSNMDDSVITCDEIIESYDKEIKIIPTNFNGKKATCKTKTLYILLTFLLITIALLIAVNNYCCMVKHWPKQKHLLPFQSTNNELKEITC